MFQKVVVVGFAIFAMLFDSGNIVFPFIIGKDFALDLENIETRKGRYAAKVERLNILENFLCMWSNCRLFRKH
ncbi:MAG: hypothetical protein IJT08_00995 [Alphaproteobacteria bacterium]|nr:hypothetical protein [Alphaproteobacteria bacterium]